MPLTKPALSLGTAGEATREPHGLPAVKQSRDCTGRGHARGEMISGPPLSGQPGKAVGHAEGKLTLRHDLAVVGHAPYSRLVRSDVARTRRSTRGRSRRTQRTDRRRSSAFALRPCSSPTNAPPGG